MKRGGREAAPSRLRADWKRSGSSTPPPRQTDADEGDQRHCPGRGLGDGRDCIANTRADGDAKSLVNEALADGDL